jgi:hypothetical protein
MGSHKTISGSSYPLPAVPTPPIPPTPAHPYKITGNPIPDCRGFYDEWEEWGGFMAYKHIRLKMKIGK